MGLSRSGSSDMLQIGEGTSTFLIVRSDDDAGTTTSRGDLGIGTTAPTALLSVNGADNNTTGAFGGHFLMLIQKH